MIRRPPPATLVLAALAVWVVWQALEPVRQPDTLEAIASGDGETAAASDEDDRDRAGAVRPDPGVDLANAIARPLMSPTRRPLVDARPPEPEPEPQRPPAPPPAPPPLDPPSLVLRGVLEAAGRRSALLAPPSGDGEWFASGDLVDGWKIARIAADHVEFENDGRIFRLDLFTPE